MQFGRATKKAAGDTFASPAPPKIYNYHYLSFIMFD